MGFAQDIGIDLGTATILVHVRGKGIVLKEPSVLAIDRDANNQVLAVGEEARRMLGRTPGNIVAIRPLKEGVISDYEKTEIMMKHFINRVCKSRLSKIFRPNIMLCVPCGATEVERRAVKNAARKAGANNSYLIDEPIAAAIGAGIDVSKPRGSMIVDIGGGTTDIAIISMYGMVVRSSIKTAGDVFDEAIVRYMRRKHNMFIGDRTAEDIKMNIGCVYPRPTDITMDIRGRNLLSGLPRSITVASSEVMEALEEPVGLILDAVMKVLEQTPPELAADISDRGIIMTGGGSLIYGIDKLIQQKTGINVIVADNAVSCVALGIGKILATMTKEERQLYEEEV